jgi:type II secretory pathway pseudopilin PulG
MALRVEMAMPLISPAIKRAHGFTLIELTVVCAILIVIAGAIVPNLLTLTQSRSLKDLEGNVARLPVEARNEALKSQNPVRLRISGTMLVMEQVPATGDPIQVKQVDLGENLQIDTVQLNGKPSDIGSWEWTVYPDGSADSGGIQFTEGKAEKSMVLSQNGTSQWISGELPDQTQDQWPAGQLLQRS